MPIVRHNCPKACTARDFQYEMYGYGNVVANQGKEKMRCTICGEAVSGSPGTTQRKKKKTQEENES